MTPFRRRLGAALALIALLVGGVAVAPHSEAAPGSDNPILDLLTTTTTAPPKATTTTAKAAPTSTTAPAQAPAGAVDAKGDGVTPPAGGIVVPPEAQAIISSVKRTKPRNDQALVEGLQALTDLGATPEEAFRIGMGRFPVAGLAHWSDDWLLPRYGPGFRFHLGDDVVADYGTPLRAAVDGVVQSHHDPLGGLSVKVVMPDKTAFYYAHLSNLVEGFQEGMAVKTGDIVGYVGDSGNAKGGTPHVHVGVYPKGGPATNPKPVLDGFLDDAIAALPGVVAAYAAAHPATPPLAVPLLPVPPDARLLRPALSARALQGFTSGGDAWTPTALYLLATDPAGGAGFLLRSTLDELVGAIDWSARELTGQG
jgi:murein DD-endopeptidase MepM/ murein hydrolase activator NlpD